MYGRRLTPNDVIVVLLPDTRPGLFCENIQ